MLTLFAFLILDPLLPMQWHLGACGFDQTPSGVGIVIGAIDTGCNPYPDLDGRLVRGRNFYDKSNVTTDYDYPGHGTATASLAVAVLGNGWGGAGCLPDAQVMPLAVWSAKGQTLSGLRQVSAIADAIAYAKRKRLGVVWINAPYGDAQGHGEIQRAISSASNVVFCWAAGNTGTRVVQGFHPANVLIVAGSLEHGEWAGLSYGPAVDVAAPARCVFSAQSGPEWTGTGYGSSNSAPIAACVAALVRQANPTWTASQVVATIKVTATDVQGLGWDETSGFGVVNAWAAWSR